MSNPDFPRSNFSPQALRGTLSIYEYSVFYQVLEKLAERKYFYLWLGSSPKTIA